MPQPRRRLPMRRRDAAELAPVVPELAPEALHELIQQRGVESSGELVAAATPEQIARVLDLDLWRAPQLGADAAFDVDRFGEWVDALVDHDPAEAARIVAAMDLRLVVVGLSAFIRVFDLAASNAKATCELAGYAIRSRRSDSWDAVVQLLVALESVDPDRFHDVMRGCRQLSDSGRELDGLDQLLESKDQWLYDIALAREERQAAQGYSTPAEARAFFELARRQGRARPRVIRAVAEVSKNPAIAHRTRFPHLRPLMLYAREHDEACWQQRTEELALLTNRMMAGSGLPTRAFTAAEASDAVVSVCNLGLEVEAAGLELPAEFLLTNNLSTAFEVGWATLYEEVTSLAAERLSAALGQLRIANPQLLRDVHALRVRLRTHIQHGTPWRVRDQLDVLTTFDAPAWMALLGLLNDCPVIMAALTAVVEGRTGTVSATAFELISTCGQIDTVHRFLERLPGVFASSFPAVSS